MTRILLLALAAAAAGQTASAKTPHGSPAPAAHTIPTTGDLGAADLIAAAATRLHFRKADEFSPDMDDHSLVGRTFRITRKFNDQPGGAPIWRYSPSDLVLEFTPTTVTTSLDGTFYGLLVGSKTTSQGSSERQNAFGAKVLVSEYQNEKVVLGAKAALGMPWLTVRLNVTPDEGRAIASGAYAVFTGRLVDSGGAVTTCGTNFIAATFDDPREVGEEDCLVEAKFESLDFFGPDGRKLGSWTPTAPGSASPVTVTWLRRPAAEDLAQYYPERASRMGVSGHATIECTVNANGTVSDCSVASESPADQEFGSAALKLSRLYKADLATISPGSRVLLPISFEPPKD